MDRPNIRPDEEDNMTEHKEWVTFDLKKQSSRVRGLPLGHGLAGLSANGHQRGGDWRLLSSQPAGGMHADRASSRASSGNPGQRHRMQ
jgi:hypothetical protein